MTISKQMSKKIKKFLDEYATLYLTDDSSEVIDYNAVEDLISEYEYLCSDENPQSCKYEYRYLGIIDILEDIIRLGNTIEGCNPDSCVAELRDALT